MPLLNAFLIAAMATSQADDPQISATGEHFAVFGFYCDHKGCDTTPREIEIELGFLGPSSAQLDAIDHIGSDWSVRYKCGVRNNRLSRCKPVDFKPTPTALAIASEITPLVRLADDPKRRSHAIVEVSYEANCPSWRCTIIPPPPPPPPPPPGPLKLYKLPDAPAPKPTVLRCFVGEDVQENRFTLAIDQQNQTMTVDSERSGQDTLKASISLTTIVGTGSVHNNKTSFEITLPDLTVRRTIVPHIWPGPIPTLVSEGRCSGDIR